MIRKVPPDVFAEISKYAPPKPAVHIFIAKSKKKKQDRYILTWKDWKMYGDSPEEIIEKLKAFKHYNFHLL